MIIFVSMRSNHSTSYFERRDGLSHDWCRLFDEFKISPILIPNALDNPAHMLDVLPGRGLLLTGGGEIGERERDHTEQDLLDAAIATSLPVFGVCRGLQMINQYFGGVLVRDGQAKHVALDHEITIIDNLGGSLQLGSGMVNSYHNDYVTVGGLAEGLRSFATTKDGVVEGLYHSIHPITAIQWHPERKSPGYKLDETLLKRWLRQCA